VIVTGDKAATARQVARKVGLEVTAATGYELRDAADAELEEMVQGTTVRAAGYLIYGDLGSQGAKV
jgi:magnesium-transporting ATPase (P-type)